MGTRIGVWLDHRMAIIVSLTEQGDESGVVVTKVEEQLENARQGPHERGFESQSRQADDSRQRSLTRHLDIYYDAVIGCLREANAILIFGPGEAKGELRKRIENGKLDERIEGVETADSMTDRQIAAKVRRYFAGEENVMSDSRGRTKGTSER
jgi:hypothetical protein